MPFSFDDFLQWLWGSSYTVHCLEVISDPWRAIVWTITNLIVALAYFGIPNEIRHWSAAVNLDMSSIVSRLFRAFSIYCGVSHIAMVLIMPTTRWEMILFFFVPLAGVSLLTYVVLRYSRQRIVKSLILLRGTLVRVQQP